MRLRKPYYSAYVTLPVAVLIVLFTVSGCISRAKH
jgi:hypothetical protein